MMIEIKKLATEIGFRVPSELYKQVKDWEYSIDKIVFEEQLSTGSFKGRLKVSEHTLQLMRLVQEQGKIMPYYGAGGSSGACIYQFQIQNDKCNFQVQHTVAGEVLDLEIDIKYLDALEPMISNIEIQFSFLQYVTDEPLEHPWTGNRNPMLICKIFEQEYQNLTQWTNWVDNEALTPRYLYQFGRVSMGGGFCIKVKDTNTGNIIDITDYDSW